MSEQAITNAGAEIRCPYCSSVALDRADAAAQGERPSFLAACEGCGREFRVVPIVTVAYVSCRLPEKRAA